MRKEKRQEVKDKRRKRGEEQAKRRKRQKEKGKGEENGKQLAQEDRSRAVIRSAGCAEGHPEDHSGRRSATRAAVHAAADAGCLASLHPMRRAGQAPASLALPKRLPLKQHSQILPYLLQERRRLMRTTENCAHDCALQS